MSGLVKRLSLLAAAFIVGLAAQAATAGAQTMSQLPPVRPLYDEHNVNLAYDLRARFIGPSISVGPAGAGGLSFRNDYTEVGYYWGYWASPYSIRADLYSATDIVTVVFNDRTETFDVSSSTTDVPSQQETGSLLTLRGSGLESDYISPDGGKIVFNMTSAVNGELKRIEQPNGEQVTMYFNGTGYDRRLQSVTNNFGYQIKLEYASNTPGNANYTTLAKATAINNAVDYCDPAANTCSGFTQAWPSLDYAVSGAGLIKTHTVTDDLGRVTTLTLDQGIILSVQTPADTTTYTRYDPSWSTDPPGEVTHVTKGPYVWTYTYGVVPPTHGYRRVTDPYGLVREVGINVNTFLLRYDIDPAGNQTSYSYTGELLTGVTYPGGQTAAYTYDGRFNRLSTTITPTAGTAATTYVSYESSCNSGNILYCNKPKTTTDALGNVTDYSYSATHGGLTAMTLPSPGGVAARPEVRTTYASKTAYYKVGASTFAAGAAVYLPTDVKTCVTGAGSACANAANEVVTTTAYPSSGAHNLLPLSVTTRDGTAATIATTAMTYNVLGQVKTVDGPLSGTADTVTYSYDAYWRPVGVVGPDPDGGGALKPAAVRTVYDGTIGNVARIERGTVNSAADSPWDTNFTVLDKTETAYDARNRPIQQTLKNGAGTILNVSQVSYDGYSRIECSMRRLNPADFASPPGACAQGTGSGDALTHHFYDAYGRPDYVNTGYGTASEQTWAYAASGSGKGKVASITDANGNKTTYGYDGFGRAYKTSYPDPTTPGTSSSTDYEQSGYDANGNVTSLRLRDGTNVTAAYDALDRMTTDMQGATFAYDNLGRVTSTTKSSATASYSYDVFGNLLSETTGLGAVSYQYDLAGRRTRLTWPDSVYVTYVWDDASNLTDIRLSGSTSLAAFAYDSYGRRTGLTRGNGTSSSYAYDDRSSLSTLGLDLASTGNDQTATFTRDAFARITKKASSNAAYVAAAPSAASLSYTPNGLNQITTGAGVSWTHDGRGNATAVGASTFTYDTANRMTAKTSASVTLAYDPVGRLYEHAGVSTTRFQYDNADLITEYNTSGTVQRRYVHGPGEDEPLVWFEGSNTSTPHYLLADERGSIAAVTDASGVAEAINTYDEYGVPSTTSATYASRFRYTGQTWFSDLGLYNYKARMYAPDFGSYRPIRSATAMG